MVAVGWFERTPAGKYVSRGSRRARVEVSTGPLLFNQVQYEPGDALTLTAPPGMGLQDLIEYPAGSRRWYRVDNAVPLPPAGRATQYLAVRFTEPGGPAILEPLAVGGSKLTIDGDEVVA